MQGFPDWRDGGRSPPLAESFFIPLHQENCPHQIFIPPLNKNFHVTSFLAVVTASVAFSF